MKTFSIQTLGCKVNHYESEQIAALLRSRGLIQTDDRHAELRIVNTCSVTMQAASKSRQTARRMVKLPVLSNEPAWSAPLTMEDVLSKADHAAQSPLRKSRLILTGCWATSDKDEASAIPGVDAVLGHHDDLAIELDKLLAVWQIKPDETEPSEQTITNPPKSVEDDGWMMRAGTLAVTFAKENRPKSRKNVNEIRALAGPGTTTLPLLGEHQSGRQRAFLKIQDGCDAHCTYCIIPQLRPRLWSKPIGDAVDEAKRLIDSGHVEIVLTGIFLGAFGHETALRRKQLGLENHPLIDLTEALCTKVAGLGRLRFSSLEPGDMTPELINVLKSHEQVVPHFHLPLQSGSDEILRKMNRQYSRDDFLRMIDNVNQAFDRPAITTDILVGFPGETEHEFDQTMDIATRANFIHTHAFPYSPRPRTAAARWEGDFVRGPIVNQRIEALTQLASQKSHEFRQSFVGETVELLVERFDRSADSTVRHGRSERYFDVHFESNEVNEGDLVKVKIDRVTPIRTIGMLADCLEPASL